MIGCIRRSGEEKDPDRKRQTETVTDNWTKETGRGLRSLLFSLLSGWTDRLNGREAQGYTVSEYGKDAGSFRSGACLP